MVAPLREVTRIVEIEGERGGVTLVCVMTCGHWMTRRAKPSRKGLRCIGCAVDEVLAGR